MNILWLILWIKSYINIGKGGNKVDRNTVRVHYYNGHDTKSIDKHIAVHIEKNENYVEIVAEEFENFESTFRRYTYPRTKIIKIVEDV